jgi:hypothetical protein
MTDTDQAARGGLSCNGVNVYGDEASIEAIRSWLHSHEQVEEWRRSLPDEITRLSAELAAARAHALETYKRWHQLEDKLRADVIAALQRADDYRKMWQENYDDVRRADEALAAERAARERIEKELRRKAHDAILTSSKVAYTDAAAIVALAAPAEASAGEAGRTFTDEMVEAGARELVRIEHAKHPWAHYMICSRAVLSAALNIHARPAQKDSEG